MLCKIPAQTILCTWLTKRSHSWWETKKSRYISCDVGKGVDVKFIFRDNWVKNKSVVN